MENKLMNKKLYFVAVVVLLIPLLFIVLLPREATPEETVMDYMKALQEEDFSRAYDYLKIMEEDYKELPQLGKEGFTKWQEYLISEGYGVQEFSLEALEVGKLNATAQFSVTREEETKGSMVSLELLKTTEGEGDDSWKITLPLDTIRVQSRTKDADIMLNYLNTEQQTDNTATNIVVFSGPNLLELELAGAEKKVLHWTSGEASFAGMGPSQETRDSVNTFMRGFFDNWEDAHHQGDVGLIMDFFVDNSPRLDRLISDFYHRTMVYSDLGTSREYYYLWGLADFDIESIYFLNKEDLFIEVNETWNRTRRYLGGERWEARQQSSNWEGNLYQENSSWRIW